MKINELHLHWRPSSYKGKVYKSYSLARPYRKNGKNRKEIVLRLGKLSNEEAEEWRNCLKAAKQPNTFLTTFNDIFTSKKYSYLDIIALNAIWNEWDLDKPFTRKSNSQISLSVIARILTINRCLNPLSKRLVCSWFKKTWLPWIYNINISHINSSRIFRELSEIENVKDKICKHLYDLLHERYPQSMNHIFYDLSSATFSGTRCILMDWGYCKEGYQNHIVLALVVNEQGLPFYWEVLEGNTADSTTIEWILKNLKHKFPNIEATLVFDRGMVSDANLSLIEKAEHKYISAMDKDQIIQIATIDFRKYSIFNVKDIEKQLEECSEFKKLNKTTYYREVKLENKRRYILCFNPQLFKDQRKNREGNIKSLKKQLKQLNKELAQAQKSRDKKSTQKKIDKIISKLQLKSFIVVSLEEIKIERTDRTGKKKIIKSYQGSIDPIDKEKRIEAEKLDGFWLLVTNHYEKSRDDFELSASKAIIPYKEKVIIESAFRDIKSFVDVAPIFVWTENHVKAHFTVCVLSYFINRIITMKLHNNQGNLTEEIITHDRLYDALSEYTVDKIHIKNIDAINYRLSLIDQKAQELLKRLELQGVIKNDLSIKAANKQLN